MQHEAALRLYRTAAEDGLCSLFGIVCPHIHLLHQLTEAEFHRLVDDDAHGALFVVFTDVGHAVKEVGVAEIGHGDEELVGEVGVLVAHGFIVREAQRRAQPGFLFRHLPQRDRGHREKS